MYAPEGEPKGPADYHTWHGHSLLPQDTPQLSILHKWSETYSAWCGFIASSSQNQYKNILSLLSPHFSLPLSPSLSVSLA
jgi:hypothetical protein